MPELLKVTLIGLASGILGTGIGGLSAFLIKDISNRYLSFILEFSAGLMTAVVCTELIPEAFESGGMLAAVGGAISGIVAILAIEKWLKDSKMLKRQNHGGSGRPELMKAGVMVALGLALHNLPEGFAVGSGFKASTGLGITVTIIIMIHDIPEGIAMAVPMRAGGLSAIKAFTYTILSGVPMGLGALIGAALGGISEYFISICLGFAAGAMLYIVFAELVPESKRLHFGRLSSIGNIMGIICGIIISL